MKNSPAISVIMPAFNAGNYIAEAIESVLIQTFTDFELVIINDGSTDDTETVIRSFTDKRIHVIKQQKTGVSGALNKGLEIAKGKYIARFDADDICFPHRLDMQYRFMEENPDHVLIGSAAEYIDRHGNYIFKWDPPAYQHQEIKKLIIRACPFDHPTVIYKKDVVLALGGYSKEALHFEDHLLWTQFFSMGKLSNLREPLIRHRFHPGSVTIDERWRGRSFARLKYNCIKKGFITEEEGERLRQIVKKQDSMKLKEGAYHALCAKKFLVNNHQPSTARNHLAKAISLYPFRLDNYALFILSYFPKPFINWLDSKIP
jgi:glycosyltransferase involved in cell wall biosynthesis